MDNKKRQLLAATIPCLSGSAVAASIFFRGHNLIETLFGWAGVAGSVLLASGLLIELKKSKR